MNALAAQVWHFWLAVPLAIGTVLGVGQLIAGYIMKVAEFADDGWTRRLGVGETNRVACRW